MLSLLEIRGNSLINSGLAKSSLLELQKIWTPSPFSLFEKNKILVLSGCNISLLVRKKSHIFFYSVLTKRFKDSTLSAEAKSVVSSANNNVKRLDAKGKLLIYRRKRRGPRIEPWGTPSRTFISILFFPLTVTNCFLSER